MHFVVRVTLQIRGDVHPLRHRLVFLARQLIAVKTVSSCQPLHKLRGKELSERTRCSSHAFNLIYTSAPTRTLSRGI